MAANILLPDYDKLWDYDAAAESEQRFRDLLPLARDSKDLSYLGGLLTQVARAQGLQRRFDEAHMTLDEAASAIESDSTSVARIRLLLERGRVFNSSGQAERAMALFLEAWERATSASEDFYAVDAAHMLGICAPEEERLKWNVQALTHAEQSANERTRNWLGSLYNNIGWTLYDMERYGPALDYFQRALAWRTDMGQPQERRIAAWCVGKALRAVGKTTEALLLQEGLLAEMQSARQDDGYVHEEIGECLLVLGRLEQAMPHFARAYATLSKDMWLSEREPNRLQRLAELGAENPPSPVREQHSSC
jgi:tetratricopeptide (TPR) repeat protein